MVEVVTFGCKLNIYETEIIKQKAKQHNLSNKTVIFNTCSVTLEAEKEAVKKIRHFKRKNPDVKIIVTGCGAQVNPEKFANLEEVELVIGNKEKLKDETYKSIAENSIKSANTNNSIYERHEDKIFFKERGSFAHSSKILVNDIFSIKETAGHMKEGIVTDFENHTRAFVQIQNGCNHRCTFCIIPFARGNSISVPFGALCNEIKELCKKGFKEIVLTGVDITDYGKDLSENLTLSKMIKRLLKLVPEMERLRLSSIDVAEVDEEMYEIIANEKRFMPYFHISLQSGDDLILKRMKRRHTRKEVIEFVKKVRNLREEVAFGADIITGFPTEEEENFLNSKKLIEECEISFCHIFSFSPHTGTPASKMPQIERGIIKERTRILIDAGKKELAKTLKKMVGSEQKILIEGENFVRCENFVQGVLQTKISAKKGDIITLKAKGIEGEKLIF